MFLELITAYPLKNFLGLSGSDARLVEISCQQDARHPNVETQTDRVAVGVVRLRSEIRQTRTTITIHRDRTEHLDLITLGIVPQVRLWLSGLQSFSGDISLLTVR